MKKVFIACLFLVAAIPALRAGEPTPCRDVVSADYSAPRDNLHLVQRPVVVFVIPAVIAGLSALETAGLIALSVPTGYCLFKVAEGVAGALDDMVIGDYLWVEAEPDGFRNPGQLPGGNQPPWLTSLARVLVGTAVAGEASKVVYMANANAGNADALAIDKQLEKYHYAPFGSQSADGKSTPEGIVYQVTPVHYVVQSEQGWSQFTIVPGWNGGFQITEPQRISPRQGRTLAHTAMANSPSWKIGLATITNDLQALKAGKATRKQLVRTNAFADGDCFATDDCLAIKGGLRKTVEASMARAAAGNATETDWIILADFKFMEFELPVWRELQHVVAEVMPIEDWQAIEPVADNLPKSPGQITFWRSLQMEQGLPEMNFRTKEHVIKQAEINVEPIIRSTNRRATADEIKSEFESMATTQNRCSDPTIGPNGQPRTGCFYDLRLRGMKSIVNLVEDGWIPYWSPEDPNLLRLRHCAGKDRKGEILAARIDSPHKPRTEVGPDGKVCSTGHCVHGHFTVFGSEKYKGMVPQGVIPGHPNDFGQVQTNAAVLPNGGHFDCTHLDVNRLGALQFYAAVRGLQLIAGIASK